MNRVAGILLCITTCFVLQSGSAWAKSNEEATGDMIQVLIPASGYLSTWLLHDKEGRIQFYKSFFTNEAVTYALKYAINKPRQENNGDYSFPSGHTSASFQGATFIHKRYGWKVGIPAYLAAAYVGWSRVEGESDKHDLVDVSTGALIGTLSSWYFTTTWEGVCITPEVGDHAYGIGVHISW